MWRDCNDIYNPVNLPKPSEFSKLGYLDRGSIAKTPMDIIFFKEAQGAVDSAEGRPGFKYPLLPS